MQGDNLRDSVAMLGAAAFAMALVIGLVVALARARGHGSDLPRLLGRLLVAALVPVASGCLLFLLARPWLEGRGVRQPLSTVILVAPYAVVVLATVAWFVAHLRHLLQAPRKPE